MTKPDDVAALKLLPLTVVHGDIWTLRADGEPGIPLFRRDSQDRRWGEKLTHDQFDQVAALLVATANALTAPAAQREDGEEELAWLPMEDVPDSDDMFGVGADGPDPGAYDLGLAEDLRRRGFQNFLPLSPSSREHRPGAEGAEPVALPAAWLVRKNDASAWDWCRTKLVADRYQAKGWQVRPLYAKAPAGAGDAVVRVDAEVLQGAIALLEPHAPKGDCDEYTATIMALRAALAAAEPQNMGGR